MAHRLQLSPAVIKNYLNILPKEYNMKTAIKTLALLITLTLATQVQAQEAENLAPLRQAEFPTSGKIEFYKDPLVATYLSASMPGLGQFYAGNKKRGLFFLTSIVGAFGSAYAFYKPAELKLADYDKTDFGGNADGLLSVGEAQNWQDNKFEDEAFDKLSTGRKVGAISGVAAGLGLYIWNIIDARSQANNHNQRLAQRRINLGLQAGPDRAGLALNINF